MANKYFLHITLLGSVDSKDLYEKIKQYNLCVTDLQDKTYIYGPVELSSVATIFPTCWEYSKGQIDVSLSVAK